MTNAISAAARAQEPVLRVLLAASRELLAPVSPERVFLERVAPEFPVPELPESPVRRQALVPMPGEQARRPPPMMGRGVP